MTIEDLQAQAWRVMALPAPKISKPVTDSAIYKYWLEHKEVGAPMCNEQPVDEGGTALFTVTGRILHWLGGDEVEVR